jgi:hypothetical protein
MDAEWAAVLEAHRIPYFHMVDCAHGTGVFAGMAVEERSEIVKKLITLIKKYTLEGFANFMSADAYETSADALDVYSQCTSSCVTALQLFLKTSRVDGKIAYFFESGHKNKGKAYNHIARILKRPDDSLTFAAKEDVRLLQAADLLAWQCTKYAKDWLYPKRRNEPVKREPRKDFKSLMEHSHSFMHAGMKGGKKYMGIELWPLSKRSPISIDASIDDDGPILVLRESGDDTPIVPVEKTLGWKMGGARLAYVQFEDMRGKPFALAFDEPRLFEAIIRLLETTKLHENSKIVPLISADAVVVDKIGQETAIRIKIREGATIGFHLPAEVLAQLVDQLKPFTDQ